MRLSLKKATFLIILSVFGVLALIFYFTSVQTLLPRFESLEREMILEDIARIQRFTIDKSETTAMLTRDWAWWDNTYAFVEDRNQDYIEGNLPVSTFDSAGLNLVAFFNSAGQQVWGAYRPPERDTLVPIPWEFEDFIFARIAPWGKDYTANGFKGLASMGDQLMIVACEQILTSKQTGPSKGWMLMGTLLTPDILEQWATKNDLKLTARRIAPTEGVVAREYPLIETDHESISAQAVITDMNGVPVMLVQTSSPSVISDIGDDLVSINFGVMSMACLFMAAVALLLLRFQIIRRISLLARQVNSIAQSPDEAYDIAIPGYDEITELAQNVNGMVHQIKEEKRFLDKMMRSLQVGIFLISVETRKIVEANPYACMLVGLTCEEIVGQRCHGFICPNEENACPVLDLGQPNELQRRILLRGDGYELPVLKSVTPITRNGVAFLLESFVDISELENTRSALEASESRYRTIFNSTGTASVIVNEDTTLAMANSEFYRFSGYRQKDIEQGLKWTECFHSDDVKWMIEYHKQRRQDETGLPRTYEARFIDASGEIRIVELTVSMFPGTTMSIASLLDVTARKRLEHRLTHKAFHDDLTGLPNRLLFRERLIHALSGADRRGTLVGVVLIAIPENSIERQDKDLEFIDEAAKQITARLQKIVRGHDTLARLENDMIAVICEDIESLAHCPALVIRIMQAFDQPFDINQEPRFLSAPIGMALYPHDAVHPDELMRCAETALEKTRSAKDTGFGLYSKDMTYNVAKSIQHEAILEKALRNNEFSVWFMPSLHVKSDQPIGFSCELHLPGTGDQFSAKNRAQPFARSDLARSMDLLAIQNACKAASKIKKATGKAVEILYQLSSASIRNTSIIAQICNLLENDSLERQQLLIALPPRILSPDFEMGMQICEGLKTNGIKIALSEFGPECPPVERLEQAAPTRLILDNGIVSMTDSSSHARPELAQEVIRMGKTLGIGIMGKEVRTQTQKDFLTRYGCDYLQGIAVSPPQDWNGLMQLFPGNNS